MQTEINLFGNLNEQQRLAVMRLAQGERANSIAEALEVAPETISRWRQQEEFGDAIDRLQRAAFESNLQRMRGLIGTALDTIEDVLTDEEANPKVRVDASFKLLQLIKMDEKATPHHGTHLDELMGLGY